MVRRCLFLLDSLSVGGSERKTVRAANRLVDSGVEVHVGFLNSTTGLRNTIDPRIRIFEGSRSGKLDVGLTLALRRYIRDNNIDTAWAVNLYPLLYIFLATRGRARRMRVIGTSNITIFRNSYEERKMRIYAPIIRNLDAFVFGSHQQKSLWVEKYPITGVELDVIHNGVDTERFCAAVPALDRQEHRKNFGFDDKHVVVGMVAQFRIEKAHDDLLAACKSLKAQGHAIKVLLVGEGVERERIAALVMKSGLLDDVVFTGQLDDVRPALAAMDIFALTSRAVETFSNAALEAMAMSLPAVLSDLSGAREMVEDGVNGFVYPPGDVDALTRVLLELMEDDTRKTCASNARKIVEQRFSETAMAENYIRLIGTRAR